MALKDYRKIQLEKRKELLAKSKVPYPIKAKRTHTTAETEKNFTALKRQTKEITLAGRIMSLRRHGGATFGNLQDASGEFQFLFRRDNMGKNAYEEIIDTITVGDFLQIQGSAFLTKRKERTLEVKKGTRVTKTPSYGKPFLTIWTPALEMLFWQQMMMVFPIATDRKYMTIWKQILVGGGFPAGLHLKKITMERPNSSMAYTTPKQLF